MKSFLKKLGWGKKKEKNPKNFKRQAVERFFYGMSYGLGQALGLTLIFAFLVSYLAKFLTALGGIPFIGHLLANIVNSTQKALEGLN